MTRLHHELSLTDPKEVREAEINKIAESREDVRDLRQHLREIIEGKAFRGSHRSGQFLVYIVNHAIDGQFDSLKERVIGIELFGRTPSYDTGDDAIVRVTASDVRKRLMQHYGENGRSAKFYISLPSGSYIPEITRNPNGNADPIALIEKDRGLQAGSHLPEIAHLETVATLHEAAVAAPQETIAISAESEADPRISTLRVTSRIWSRWLSVGILVLALNVGVWAFFWTHPPSTASAAISALPWSAFLSSSHATHLITSDPNIVYVQEITGSELSVSDYANRQYIPEDNKLTPAELRICRIFLWGDNSAGSVDAPIAIRIAGLAQAGAKKIDAIAARSIQLAYLKNDDNFILLGSPRSNPWTALFSDQLDFRFVFDKAGGREIITNVHPRAHELPTYVPTAAGWATGQSFAIIAFVQNPDQNGQVLLLAGANAEGTEAAGKFVTDVPRLTAALDRCGIHSGRPLQHFELLLGLKTMAGSPNDVDIIACHILPGAAGH